MQQYSTMQCTCETVKVLDRDVTGFLAYEQPWFTIQLTIRDGRERPYRNVTNVFTRQEGIHNVDELKQRLIQLGYSLMQLVINVVKDFEHYILCEGQSFRAHHVNSLNGFYSAQRFSIFSLIFSSYFGSCGRLSWLTASFRAHVNIVSLLTYLLEWKMTCSVIDLFKYSVLYYRNE